MESEESTRISKFEVGKVNTPKSIESGSKLDLTLLPSLIITLLMFFVLPNMLNPLYRYLPYNDLPKMYFFGTYLTHSFTIIFINLLMIPIYKYSDIYLRQYRIINEPWPWQQNPKQFKEQLPLIIRTLAINHLLVLPALSALIQLCGLAKFETDPNAFPSGIRMIAQLCFFMVIHDTLSYWVHRLMHTPAVYKHFHKRHHEHKSSISISAGYEHPFEYLALDLIPGALGPILLGANVHLLTMYYWMFLRALGNIEDHCGYDFPWTPYALLPYSGGGSFHSYHHSHNLGNYASFFECWDMLCNTNASYMKYLSKANKKEAE